MTRGVKIKISLFRGGYRNKVSTETVDTWDELVDLVSQPEIGQKNGDYITRGFCDGERADKNMTESSLIIIDGDQTLTNGSSCAPLLPAHKVLKSEDITHVIYNSYSNDPYNNINKWRILVPCPDILDGGTLSQGVAEIITLLHGGGVDVRNVGENQVLSQPWFTPRVKKGFEDDFDFREHTGSTYRLTGLVEGHAGYSKNTLPFDMLDGGSDGGKGIFSWETVGDMFRSGTLHQGLKSACGWMVFSTDWPDSQIKQMLGQLVLLCPDADKVERASGKGEIDSLLKYCREKQGVTSAPEEGNWKDHLINADDLKNKVFPPIVWAVDDVIPEGLTILAGDPKVGKSLMAVDICNSIASGKEAFGGKRCVKGDVVYLSMEDPPRRVKERIFQQCDLWPDTFHLVTGGLQPLGAEFYKTVDEMLMLWPECRAIVVDTLNFIDPPKKTGESDYKHYYSILDPLHRWSLDNHVAFILITHKKKGKSNAEDNPFSDILGSVALQSTTDAMIMLCRNHSKKGGADGFLNVIGREIAGNRFALDFDSEAMKWSLRDDGAVAEQITGNPRWSQIEGCLTTPKGPSEISTETGLNPNTVKTCLRRMKSKGLVSNKQGKWFTPIALLGG